jgi:ketosteroid isomerase-like protein
MKAATLFLGLVFLFTFYSCKPDQEKAKTEIINTEREFEKMAAERGLAEAFSFFVADSGVLNRGTHIIKGKNEVRKRYEKMTLKEVTLSWKPDYVDVASSCDLGYTYGKYIFTYRDSTGKLAEDRGIFHTVWKRQEDGSWRFVWD